MLDLTLYEVGSVLLRNHHLRAWTGDAQFRELLSLLGSLESHIEVEPVDALEVVRTLDIALEASITFYGAAYEARVELEDATLVTEDREFRTAASQYVEVEVSGSGTEGGFSHRSLMLRPCDGSRGRGEAGSAVHDGDRMESRSSRDGCSNASDRNTGDTVIIGVDVLGHLRRGRLRPSQADDELRRPRRTTTAGSDGSPLPVPTAMARTNFACTLVRASAAALRSKA